MGDYLGVGLDVLEEGAGGGEEALADVVAGELGGLEEGDLEALAGEGGGSVAAGGAAADDEDLRVCGLEGRVSVGVGTGEALTIECIFVR